MSDDKTTDPLERTGSSGFKAPRRKHTVKTTSVAYDINDKQVAGKYGQVTNPVSTNKKFGLLNPIEDIDDNGSEVNSSVNDNDMEETNQSRKFGLPITFTYKGSDSVTDLINQIRIIDKNLILKTIASNEYKITPTSQQAYRELIAFMEKHNTHFDFHTYLPKESKPHRIVIRGLPSKMDPNYISQQIEIEHGIKPRQVFNAMHTTGDLKGTLMPIYYVDFSFEDDLTKLMSIKHLAYISCKVEEFRPRSGPIHCKKCQLWNHARGQCSRPARCGICAGLHENITKKCVNCGEAHSSSWKGCQVYRKLAGIGKLNRTEKHKSYPQLNTTTYVAASKDQFPLLPVASQSNEQFFMPTQPENTPLPSKAIPRRRYSDAAQQHNIESKNTGTNNLNLGSIVKEIITTVVQQVIGMIKSELLNAFKSINFSQLIKP
ncbi:hypothetical protein GE061_012265 [Apolygus lucorum]|uniref:Pre-C2HC domain-containing protein n=1 Tax=Apolygus lucorum TaxID=248454 RepID=A0A8S9XRV2_APOLU|nr:hypothetical protein GE061_012265 [Apolygus lucorum]